MDPEHARREADRLTRLARQAQDKARDAEADLAAARQAAERGYWQDAVKTFYATGRREWDTAWQAVHDAAATGDGAAVLSAWLRWREARGRVIGQHGVLTEHARRLNIAGMRPHLSGVDSSERRKLGAALDAITDRLEADAYRAARAELHDGVTQARRTAEADRRHGRTVDPTAELVPVAEFHSPDYPELTVNLGHDVSLKFHSGHLAVHDQATVDRLRERADALGIVEVVDESPAA